MLLGMSGCWKCLVESPLLPPTEDDGTTPPVPPTEDDGTSPSLPPTEDDGTSPPVLSIEDDGTASPPNVGAQPLEQEGSPGQDATLQAAIMGRIDAMMAEPLNISGGASQPLWLQEMMRNAGQPSSVSSATPVTARPAPLVSATPPAPPIPATAPVPPLQTTPFPPPVSAAPPQPVSATPPPPLVSAAPPTPPVSTSPPPLSTSATTPATPAQAATTGTTKKRRFDDTQPPPELTGKKQKEHASPAVPAQPTPATAPQFPAPLPAESSFIPMLKQSDLDDVLDQGVPVRLGSGASGEILLKRMKADGTLVAVKRLLDVQDPIQGYQAMLTEIRTMMAVQHLQEFPKVWGIIDQTTFAIEFLGDPATLTATDLYYFLESPPAGLQTSDLIAVSLDVARGLLSLHAAGWSHNDLHNANVMVWRDPGGSNHWAAKIIDLGLATRIDLPPPAFMFDSAKKASCYQDCPHMPPEVIEGVCQLGVQTDIYGLGDLFRDIAVSSPDLAALQDIADRCCKRMPHDRPTLQTVIQDLERFQATKGGGPP